jgi:hypothetical protein
LHLVASVFAVLPVIVIIISIVFVHGNPMLTTQRRALVVVTVMITGVIVVLFVKDHSACWVYHDEGPSYLNI